MTRKNSEATVEKQGRGDSTALPAYFLSLSVENVRCFGPRQTLNLSDDKGRPAQWTIILGDNGVGKTTLLQSFFPLLPVEDPWIGGSLETENALPSFGAPLRVGERDHKDYGRERGIVPRIMGDLRLFCEWEPRRFDKDSCEISGTFFTGANLKERINGNEIGGFHVAFDTGSVECSLAPKWHQIGRVDCFGYGAARRQGETSLSDRFGDDPSFSLFFEDAPLINAEEWLLRADYAASKSSPIQKQATRQRDQIKEILIKLLPDVTNIRFAQLTEAREKPRIEVKTPYGWVSVKDLSLGYKTLIAWMVDLASRLFERYPDSSNPLTEAAVVLVDEIDLHLHPKWQRSLMGYLTDLFPNTQFIATAHSPLVVQAATDANIAVLRREGDHVIIDNDVEAIRGWRIDQVLTSDLFGLESARPPELDDLLAERRRILSKGKITQQDKGTLRKLEAKIGPLPAGETREDMEAMDIIRRAAERLK